MKKILIIAVVLVILLGGGWYFFMSDKTALTTQQQGTGLPFGSGENINIPSNPPDTVGATTTADQNIGSETKIFRLSNTPTAGFVAFTKGTSTIVRYMDRATGNIFDFSLPKPGQDSGKTRITNTTIPKVYEAYFRNDGSNVLIRSLDSSENITNTTLAITPPKNSTSTEDFYSINSTILRGNIDSILSGTGNNLFYVLKDSSAIVSSLFDGTGAKTIYSSKGFAQWRLGRAGTNLLTYTKADSRVPGYAYILNVTSGGLSKVAGPFNGLTGVANNNGSQVLYSYSSGAKTFLALKNITKNTSTEILPGTLAEKCVWSTKTATTFFCGAPTDSVSGQEPEGWYQGKTHFSDYLWQFDTNSEISKLVIEPKAQYALDLDIYKPTLTPNEDYLVFINKTDLTLWAVKL